jgi:hypothetical protein
MKIIGNIDRRKPRNKNAELFMNWLATYNGCIFNKPDWYHFREQLFRRMVYYNENRAGFLQLKVNIVRGTITVLCGNDSTGWQVQMTMTVITVRSEYNIELSEPVEVDYAIEDDEEGGRP